MFAWTEALPGYTSIIIDVPVSKVGSDVDGVDTGWDIDNVKLDAKLQLKDPGTKGLGLALIPWVRGTLNALRGGIREWDTLQYHMPAAARFVQDGSVTRLHYFGNAPVSFYPMNSELVHAIADACLAAGHRVSAREAYLRASNYYRTAEFFRRTW